MEEKRYELLIGEGSEGMLPRSEEIDNGEFFYCCLEHLTFSEVIYVMELFHKQTYRPLISVREERDE